MVPGLLIDAHKNLDLIYLVCAYLVVCARAHGASQPWKRRGADEYVEVVALRPTTLLLVVGALFVASLVVPVVSEAVGGIEDALRVGPTGPSPITGL